ASRKRADELRAEVRDAGRLAMSQLRGTAAAVQVWGDVLRTAMQSWWGSTPKETTYSDLRHAPDKGADAQAAIQRGHKRP
ncbi:MAG: hypothetical protein KDA75_20490, partial [Planctomycetaceae bacterium]|nr:hypothetical protein [Planctomycetaceae bacterium]